MFAVSHILAGETLIVWGDCYTNEAGALKAKQQGKGIMQWDDDIFSYESDENNNYYAINHSCNPNSWLSDAYTVTAGKNISAGKEITIDYALWENDEEYVAPWSCNCDSKFCRGKITGKDWKNEKLQKRYEGHFSPLINKLITKAKLLIV